MLGICVAVVSWAVTQLSATLANENVLGYTISASKTDEATREIYFYLENLSKSHSPAKLTISVIGNKTTGCIKDFGYTFADFALRVSTDTAIEPGRKGYEKISIENFPSGAARRLYRP